MTLSLTDSYPNVFATNQTTLAVTNTTVGDYRVCAVKISSVLFTTTGLSGGGVTTWTQLAQGNGNAHDLSIFGGAITSTGSKTITATYSGTPGATCELWSSEIAWSGGVPASWSAVAAGTLFNVASSTITDPELTSTTGSNQGYWGFFNAFSTGSAGSTSGFSYSSVNANGDLAAFNGGLSASTAYQPTANDSVSGLSQGVGAIIQAITAASLTGTIASTSTVVGSLTAQTFLTGMVVSTSTVVGQPTIPQPLTGLIASTSTVTGSLTVLQPLTGLIASTSTVVGSLTAKALLTGTVTSTSVITGSITAQTYLSGTIASTSVVSGTLTAGIPYLTGLVTSTSTISGALSAKTFLTGTVSSTSTVSGALSAKTFLTGLVASVSTVSGTLIVPSLAKAVATVGIVTGTIATSQSVTGVDGTVATVTGTISSASPVTITVSNARPVTLAKAT